MGMYDSFWFRDGAERVCCAAGHAQRGELQTKDLDCNLDRYQIAGEPLHVYGAAHRTEETSVSGQGGLLVTTSRKFFLPSATVSGEIAIYTNCDACDPIVYERAGMFGRSVDVDTTSPWCEWALNIQDGLLIDVKPVRLATREDTANEMRRGGIIVLPDDDRVALRAIAQFRDRHPIA